MNKDKQEFDFYLVCQGKVKLLTATQAKKWQETEHDDNELMSCALCFCRDEEEAIFLAQQYDYNEIQYDNIWVPELNQAIGALSEQTN